MPSFADGLQKAAISASAEAAQELTAMLRVHATRTGIKPDDAQWLAILDTPDGLVPGFLPDTPDEATGRILDKETGGLATTPTAFIRRFDHRYRDVAEKIIEGRLQQNLLAVL